MVVKTKVRAVSAKTHTECVTAPIYCNLNERKGVRSGRLPHFSRTHLYVAARFGLQQTRHQNAKGDHEDKLTTVITRKLRRQVVTPTKIF
jgi:hypothetical protein